MDLGNVATDLFNQYRIFQQIHPHLSAILNTEAVFVSGDAVSQIIVDRKINPKKLGYTAALSTVYGLAFEGLMETGNLVGKVIDNVIARAALGPNLFGNAYNTFFFVNNTVGEKTGYNIIELLKQYKKILIPEDKTKSWRENFVEEYWNNVPKKQYLNSVIGTLTFWNIFWASNYYFVPEELQLPIALGTGLIWNSMLTSWSLRGGRRIANQEKGSSTLI